MMIFFRWLTSIWKSNLTEPGHPHVNLVTKVTKDGKNQRTKEPRDEFSTRKFGKWVQPSISIQPSSAEWWTISDDVRYLRYQTEAQDLWPTLSTHIILSWMIKYLTSDAIYMISNKSEKVMLHIRWIDKLYWIEWDVSNIKQKRSYFEMNMALKV